MQPGACHAASLLLQLCMPRARLACSALRLNHDTLSPAAGLACHRLWSQHCCACIARPGLVLFRPCTLLGRALHAADAWQLRGSSRPERALVCRAGGGSRRRRRPTAWSSSSSPSRSTLTMCAWPCVCGSVSMSHGPGSGVLPGHAWAVWDDPKTVVWPGLYCRS